KTASPRSASSEPGAPPCSAWRARRVESRPSDIQVCLVDYTSLSHYCQHMASRGPGGEAGRSPDGARERILETAYLLFSRNGIHAVGIDRIISEAGIAK